MLKNPFAAVALAAFPLQARAHEGHGTPGQGHLITYYVFDPLHLPLALLAIAASLWLMIRMRKIASRAHRGPR